MIEKKIVVNGQCYNKVERYGIQSCNTKQVSSNSSPSNYSRKKNNSFSSSTYSPDKNSSCSYAVNYYSDTSASYIQTGARKLKARRSLSSSPTLISHYAGAKFSEPPSPSVLPLPPTHWTELVSVDSTRRSVTPVDSDKESIVSCPSTPLMKVVASAANMNQSVELFFKKCSFNQIDQDFTQQLKTLLNVPA